MSGHSYRGGVLSRKRLRADWHVGSHHTTLWLTLILSVLLIIANTFTDAQAQGSIIVNITPPEVTLDYQLALQENATTLSNASVVLDSSNSSQSQFVNSLQNAMQRLVPGIVVDPSTFTFAASVRQQSQNSSTWIMSENLTFTVSGAASNKPGMNTYNLGFIAMNMSDSLKFGGVEFNNVGPAYLVSPINSQPASTTFYLDRSLVRGGPYLNPVIPSLTTQKFSLLDFSWIPKISDWMHTYRPLDTSSSWTLNPGKDRPGLPYNLTMGIKSPEGPLLTSLVAFYTLNLQLTAPARAVANGSTISFTVPAGTDFVLPAIVGTTVILAGATFLAEKKLVKPVGQYKKKRKG